MTEPATTCPRSLRLCPGVSVATGVDGQVALIHGSRWGEHLGLLTDAETAALHELNARELPEPELRARLGPGSFLLHRLYSGGWLTVTYGLPQRPLVTIRPLGPHREPRPAAPAAPRLSRFAVLHREDDALMLESPLARAAVVVHDPDVVAVIHHLTGAGRAPVVGLPRGAVEELIVELAWYGFVHEAEEDVRPDLATEQWSPHELWFHSRSRAGYRDAPFGGTLWASGRHAPLPARREPWSGTAVALPAPKPGAPVGPAFSTVLEARRSVRDAGTHPLTLVQLGEFLHWTARVRHITVEAAQEVSQRPSPSGGALHALELYPVVTNVSGLPSGLYHYDPFDHTLEPVPATGFAARALADRAAAAADGSTPQVLFVITARFGRVMWKYQSMAYALILKDLGALMQTMYLVATSMDLAPCALGAGDADLFAQATSLDQLVEASVGEFMLSTRAK